MYKKNVNLCHLSEIKLRVALHYYLFVINPRKRYHNCWVAPREGGMGHLIMKHQCQCHAKSMR